MKGAKILSHGSDDPVVVTKACFEFVRDEIGHSWDFQLNPVTSRASDVLKYGTGYCYAKSHQLATLLRANQISAGPCYKGSSIMFLHSACMDLMRFSWSLAVGFALMRVAINQQ